MDEPVEFDRSPDVLYHGVALRHVVELPVLGVPVRFESNSAAAIETVEDAFAMWRALRASPELIAPPSLRGGVIVHEGGEGGGVYAPGSRRLPHPDSVILQPPPGFRSAYCSPGEGS